MFFFGTSCIKHINCHFCSRLLILFLVSSDSSPMEKFNVQVATIYNNCCMTIFVNCCRRHRVAASSNCLLGGVSLLFSLFFFTISIPLTFLCVQNLIKTANHLWNRWEEAPPFNCKKCYLLWCQVRFLTTLYLSFKLPGDFHPTFINAHFARCVQSIQALFARCTMI